VSIVLVPVEPVLKPRKRTTLRIGDREYCVLEDTIQHGQGYVAFVDCSGNHVVVPIQQ